MSHDRWSLWGFENLAAQKSHLENILRHADSVTPLILTTSEFPQAGVQNLESTETFQETVGITWLSKGTPVIVFGAKFLSENEIQNSPVQDNQDHLCLPFI